MPSRSNTPARALPVPTSTPNAYLARGASRVVELAMLRRTVGSIERGEVHACTFATPQNATAAAAVKRMALARRR